MIVRQTTKASTVLFSQRDIKYANITFGNSFRFSLHGSQIASLATLIHTHIPSVDPAVIAGSCLFKSDGTIHLRSISKLSPKLMDMWEFDTAKNFQLNVRSKSNDMYLFKIKDAITEKINWVACLKYELWRNKDIAVVSNSLSAEVEIINIEDIEGGACIRLLT